MALSYEIDFDEEKSEYKLYCFEDDDCIWEDTFKRHNEAFLTGEQFICGEAFNVL